MFKFNAKFEADLLLYSLSHFECNSHTVHMLTQQCLLPPLTRTVKSSLFTHVHSSPHSVAARLHWQAILVILTMAGLFPDRPHILIMIAVMKMITIINLKDMQMILILKIVKGN